MLFRVTITPAPESAVDVPVGKAGHGWDVAIDPATGIGERILTPEEHQAEMTGHGAFPLVAYYPGTTLTAPSESTKQWLTIVKHPTTTTVSVEPAAVTAGSSATIDVAVVPAPTTLLHAGVTVAHPTLADWSTSVPLGAEGDGSVVFDSTGWPDGTFEVTATWAGTNDDASSTDTSAITIDSTGPVGSIVVGGGAAYTKSTAVTLAVAAVDALSDIEAIQLSNDGTNWTTRPYAASQPWTLPAVDGTRTVRVRWQDELGNWSPIATDSITLDRVAPTTSAPSRRLPAGTVLASGRIQLRSTWTGADATGGIHHHELAFGPTAAAGDGRRLPDGSDVDRPLATEHDYQVRVRAVDKAGNTGPWVEGTAFRVSRVSEFNPRIAYLGTWTTVADPALFGGGAKRATALGARATLAFTGRSVAWIASTGPDRGKANVYVDGLRVARSTCTPRARERNASSGRRTGPQCGPHRRGARRGHGRTAGGRCRCARDDRLRHAQPPSNRSQASPSSDPTTKTANRMSQLDPSTRPSTRVRGAITRSGRRSRRPAGTGRDSARGWPGSCRGPSHRPSHRARRAAGPGQGRCRPSCPRRSRTR